MTLNKYFQSTITGFTLSIMAYFYLLRDNVDLLIKLSLVVIVLAIIMEIRVFIKNESNAKSKSISLIRIIFNIVSTLVLNLLILQNRPDQIDLLVLIAISLSIISLFLSLIDCKNPTYISLSSNSLKKMPKIGIAIRYYQVLFILSSFVFFCMMATKAEYLSDAFIIAFILVSFVNTICLLAFMLFTVRLNGSYQLKKYFTLQLFLLIFVSFYQAYIAVLRQNGSFTFSSLIAFALVVSFVMMPWKIAKNKVRVSNFN